MPQTVPVRLVVNGRTHELEVEPRLLLVHALRDELELTGTRAGCDTSSCGACTVHLDGQAVKSCTVLAAQADGSNVTTIEGISGPDRLHPLQEAFAERDGLPCDFCTPGMIMAGADLLRRDPDPSEAEVRSALEGNLCRCAGEDDIVEAILAAKTPEGREATPVRSSHAPGSDPEGRDGGAGPIPTAFEYAVPASLSEAVALLAEGGEDAKPLAGGQSLIPLMRSRRSSPSLLVDLRRLPGMVGVSRTDGEFVIGAMTPHATLEGSPELGLLSCVAATIADPQVRHRGTIGGSLVHGDAASDLPAVLLAAEGSLTVSGSDGERTIAAADLFRDDAETSVRHDEIVTAVRMPAHDGWGFGYQKLDRPGEGWTMLAVSALVLAREGVCEDVRVGLTNMGPTPVRARAVEEALRGQPLDAACIEAAAALAAEGTEPADEIDATGEHKRHLVREMCRRALTEAVGAG